MRPLLPTFLLTLLLHASTEYPVLYAGMGTPLFEASAQFKRLTSFPDMAQLSAGYDAQMRPVLQAGLKIDPAADPARKRAYLASLRKLRQTHQGVVHHLSTLLEQAVDDADAATFDTLASLPFNGLFAGSAFQEKIITYYQGRTQGNAIPAIDTLIQQRQSIQPPEPYVVEPLPIAPVRQYKRTEKRYTVYKTPPSTTIRPVRKLFDYITHLSGGTTKRIVIRRDGKMGFVASQERGVYIVDLSNPARPVKKLFFRFHPNKRYDSAQDVALCDDGRTLFVADSKGAAYNLDVSDPAHPTLISSFPVYRASRVSLSHDEQRVYVSGRDGVSMLKRNRRGELKPVGRLQRRGNRFVTKSLWAKPRRKRLDQMYDAVEVTPDLLYVADTRRGLDVVDLTIPYSPRLIHHYDPDFSPWGVSATGNRVLVFGDNRVEVLDASDPRTPRLLGTFDTDGSITHAMLTASGTMVVTTLNEGLDIVDVRRPQNMITLRHVGSKEENRRGQMSMSAISPDNRYLYVSFGVRGLGTLKLW